MDTANGRRGARPANSNTISVPQCNSHLPAVVSNSPKNRASSLDCGRKRQLDPESSRCEPDPAVEQQDVEGRHLTPEIDRLFTPSPSPIPDQDHVPGPDSLTHVFTPSPSPNPDSNQNLGTGPDLAQARASSQLPVHLIFTPSPSPKPASKLPGPDLADIFTPTASPPPVPSLKPEPSLPRSATHLTSTKPTSDNFKPSPASSSTLSDPGSCDSLSYPLSVSESISTSASKSWTKRDKRSDAHQVFQCSRLPAKILKTPKTPKTPEKCKDASPRSASGKVPSVKKPVISRPHDHPSWPMDTDDDFRGDAPASTPSRTDLVLSDSDSEHEPPAKPRRKCNGKAREKEQASEQSDSDIVITGAKLVSVTGKRK